MSGEADEHRGRLHEQLRGRAEQLRESRERRKHIDELKADIDRELDEAHPNREQLQKKYDEYAALRAERRRQRVQQLTHRFRSFAESEPMKAELERHGRVVARLERIRYLCATERSDAQRKRLQERVTRLTALEEARHRETLQKLTSRPEAAPSSAPSGAKP